jgi:hypothetical protein
MAASANSTQTQADQIHAYLAQDPETPRRAAEVANAIGVDDAGRLGSYLANLARRGTIARAGTGLYTIGPHTPDQGAGERDPAESAATAGTAHTQARKSGARKSGARKSGPAKRATRRSAPPAAAGTGGRTLTTAGTLDDGRLILREETGRLWVAEPLTA